MNTVKIVLDRAEYIAGGTVFGAVYVKVTQPTQATGIILRFQGCEYYYYSGLLLPQYSEEDKDRTLQDRFEHIPQKQVQLLTGPEPIHIGAYVFPFMFRFPQEGLPSSCRVVNETGPSWELHSVYELQAEFNNSQQTRTTQGLFVVERTIPQMPVSAQCQVSRIPKRIFEVEARLSRVNYAAKENIELDLDFIGERNVRVSSVAIRLLRKLEIRISNDEGGRTTLSIGEDLELWNNTIRTDHYPKVLDSLRKIMIPVPDHITPTTTGKLVSCRYYLSIDVQLNVNKAVHLNVPVALLGKPTDKQEIHNTKEPKWAPSCQVCLTQHSAAPTHNERDNYRRKMPVLHSKWEETVVLLD